MAQLKLILMLVMLMLWKFEFLFPHQPLVGTSVKELEQNLHGQPWRIPSCRYLLRVMPLDHHLMWLMISFDLIHLTVGLKIVRKWSSQPSSWPHCDSASLRCCCCYCSKFLTSALGLQSLPQWNTCHIITQSMKTMSVTFSFITIINN